ncbi:hypothetical protein IGI37_003765 [Enterococcus sp. AZ194]|uniref:MFS transporter n=1 Tax=Enterococcus sp. AZ194 TaxID=2774629 RepID=UPI003F26C96B
MNKKNKIKIGILAIALISQSGVALSPSIATIGQDFPGISISLIQSLVTIGGFTGFFSALLCGKLQDYFSLRQLGIFSTALVFIFGSLPIILHTNFYVLLVFSGVVGFGTGMITVVSPSLISTYFQGDERSSFLGKQTAFQGIGNMATLAIGGYLATYGWVNNYYIFLLPAISLLLFILMLPKDIKSPQSSISKEEDKTLQTTDKTSKLSLTAIPVLTLLFVSVSITVITAGVMNNVSIFTAQHNIGDTSVSGLALSTLSLGSISAGLLINRVTRLFKSYTLLSGYLLLIFSFLCLLYLPNIFGLFVGSYLAGLGAGIVMTRLVFLLTSLVKEKLIPKVVSLYSAFTSIGFFISAFLLNELSSLFTNDLTKGSFIVSIVLSLLICFLLLATKLENKVVFTNQLAFDK